MLGKNNILNNGGGGGTGLTEEQSLSLEGVGFEDFDPSLSYSDGATVRYNGANWILKEGIITEGIFDNTEWDELSTGFTDVDNTIVSNSSNPVESRVIQTELDSKPNLNGGNTFTNGTQILSNGSLEIDNAWDTVLTTKESGTTRWKFIKRGAEGGGDTGSQFSLALYNDAGVWSHDGVKASREFNSVGLGGAEPEDGFGTVVANAMKVSGDGKLQLGDTSNWLFNSFDTSSQLDISNEHKIVIQLRNVGQYQEGDYVQINGAVKYEQVLLKEIGGANYGEEYIKLGTLLFQSSTRVATIEINAGVGYNGVANQNSRIVLTAKSGNTDAAGISFSGTRFGRDLGYPHQVYLDRVGTSGRVYNLVVKKKSGWIPSFGTIEVKTPYDCSWTFSKEAAYTPLNAEGPAGFIKAEIAHPEIHIYDDTYLVNADTSTRFFYIDNGDSNKLKYYDQGTTSTVTHS